MQSVELVAEDRVGNTRTLEARLHWKQFESGSRVRILVDSPEDVRGSAYLVIEGSPRDEMFVYLPALRKVRRITTVMMSNQLWGTDFSYEDIKQIEGILIQGEVVRRADDTIDGRAAYLLSLSPAPEEKSSYERIDFTIDQQTCVVLITEFVETGGRLRKRLLSDPAKIASENGRHTPREFEMRDLRDETRSWLRVVKAEYDIDVADRTFNPALLGRSR